jgi:nucleoside-diphosphate-sugar epimerase
LIVLIAGATGAVGRPLVQQLVSAGHEVIGTTRSVEKLERLCSAVLQASSSTPATPVL